MIFYFKDALTTMLCDMGIQPRTRDQLKVKTRGHLDQYERGPRSRIKSFRREYRGLLHAYLPDPLVEPPLPTFPPPGTITVGGFCELPTKKIPGTNGDWYGDIKGQQK